MTTPAGQRWTRSKPNKFIDELQFFSDRRIAELEARVNGLEKDGELLRQSRDDFRIKYESVKNDMWKQFVESQAELERVRGELATYKETKHDAI